MRHVIVRSDGAAKKLCVLFNTPAIYRTVANYPGGGPLEVDG